MKFSSLEDRRKYYEARLAEVDQQIADFRDSGMTMRSRVHGAEWVDITQNTLAMYENTRATFHEILNDIKERIEAGGQ
jgi:CTP-dependent riboflavin kinase